MIDTVVDPVLFAVEVLALVWLAATGGVVISLVGGSGLGYLRTHRRTEQTSHATTPATTASRKAP